MRYVARRCFSALILAAYLSACTKWEVPSVAPEQAFSDSSYVRKGVRITTLDGQKLEIGHPTLTGGSITGRTKDSADVAIPLQSVRELAVKRSDDGRTFLLVLGSLVGAGAATFAVGCIIYCGVQD